MLDKLAIISLGYKRPACGGKRDSNLADRTIDIQFQGAMRKPPKIFQSRSEARYREAGLAVKPKKLISHRQLIKALQDTQMGDCISRQVQNRPAPQISQRHHIPNYPPNTDRSLSHVWPTSFLSIMSTSPHHRPHGEERHTTAPIPPSTTAHKLLQPILSPYQPPTKPKNGTQPSPQLHNPWTTPSQSNHRAPRQQH